MDGQHFDRLTQSLLASTSRRRAAGLLGVLGLSLLGSGRATEAKHKKHKKHKKPLSPPVSPPASPPATPPPPPACVPDSQVTTCGGFCNTKANNCGQIVTCPCLGTKTCLGNGSCVQTCSVAAQNCPGACAGCVATVDGQGSCTAAVAVLCPQAIGCAHTVDCPPGFGCFDIPGACPVSNKLCFPLCTA